MYTSCSYFVVTMVSGKSHCSCVDFIVFIGSIWGPDEQSRTKYNLRARRIVRKQNCFSVIFSL